MSPERVLLVILLVIVGVHASTVPPRLVALEDDEGLAVLVELLADVDDAELQLDLLQGMREGLRGRSSVPMPRGWRKAYAKLAQSKSAQVRRETTALALTFGDKNVLDALGKTLMNAQAPAADRHFALDALLARRAGNLGRQLLELVRDKPVQRAAIRGLAAYDSAATPRTLLAAFSGFDAPTRADAIGTLVSRPVYAFALLDAIASKRVDRREVSAFAARAIVALGDAKLSARLREIWGEVRESSGDKKALIAKYRKLLDDESIDAADPSRGRAIFEETCAPCHRLFGEGGKIGPDLTGSNRAQLDYFLENVVDPSAVVGKGYLLTNAILKTGRVVSGIVRENSALRVTLQTVNEEVVLGPDEVLRLDESKQSMMPEGLLDKLTSEQVRSLVRYLRARKQVTKQATKHGD
jgi:putative heme-binding domain-containing protein